MNILAAIDLRGGRAVQLVGGSTAEEKVSRTDPVELAEQWSGWGFHGFHVVDLDAALGEGDNQAVIGEILRVATVPVQVGGGVRSDERISELLEAGAARVVIGTRAVEDQRWRMSVARVFPDRLVIAADVRGASVLTRGWTHQTAIPLGEMLREIARDPIAGVLVTDVSREGRMEGIDEELFRGIAQATSHPVIAAGGIGGPDDLRKLAAAGAAAAVVGMSLYTGAITRSDVKELGA